RSQHPPGPAPQRIFGHNLPLAKSRMIVHSTDSFTSPRIEFSPAHPMKRSVMSSSTPLLRTAFTGLVLSTLLLSGCGTGEQAAPQAAAAQMPAPEVSVVTLKAENITLTRELPGRINASLVAEVRPQVSGIIKERLFTEGGYVKAGQPLY